MPRIFDNIEKSLLGGLKETLGVSNRSDFCVGYFNLRGWKQIDDRIESWSGHESNRCRLLVGMQRLPQDQLRDLVGAVRGDGTIDNQTAIRTRRRLAEEFRQQLTIGTPSNEDERGLRRLALQIKTKKVVVKLFLRHPLHAKLYLLFRPDPVNPATAFLGSSNLTFSGLANQGELNVDIMDHDACDKLAAWFNDRWADKFCIDISDDLVKIIDESWAGEKLLSPYHIYVKMAYHLSQEARAGLTEFYIPSDFEHKLLEFQKAAVKIAAHHLNKRGGVLLGDVVGLGKTLMATALARVVQETQYISTLILCPPKLIPMWNDYVNTYGLQAMVKSLGAVDRELRDVPARFRLVLIDESHNLRNRVGRRYQAIREYISQSNSKVILLSATPYNKTYLDLSNQLRLFIPDDADIGIRPENKLREIGETEFIRRHQCPVRSLAAFEKSEHPDDWRELMRLYLVRRTRSFIKENYGKIDDAGKKYLLFENGQKSYFPQRVPKTVKFVIDDKNPADQYARLYSQPVVDSINKLGLPRYGLGNYVAPAAGKPPSNDETKILDDLSRAGTRLMGFCRTNLFKRLESSGHAFMQSIERHILRNYIYLHAIDNNEPLPIGTQDMGLLDLSDDDDDDTMFAGSAGNAEGEQPANDALSPLLTEVDYKRHAAVIYQQYKDEHHNRFKWLRPDLFVPELGKDIKKDAKTLLSLLKGNGVWNPATDAKLNALEALLMQDHPDRKVLIFTQFADTVDYLVRQLRFRGVSNLVGVTGQSFDPTWAAWQFSPVSNNKRDRISPNDEHRVLIATDILSEGQNLQDCSIIVNFDLPWAIIRLIQRAGRVDRIGQQAENILCYSFLPADGVERIIRLRARVRTRLKENAEVVGTDESFFEDDRTDQTIRHLFTESAGLLDGDDDDEVDLASYAYQIWKNAIEREPSLENLIPSLPPVSHASRTLGTGESKPPGALVYLRTPQDNDALAWIDRHGNPVTESQFEILRAAECLPDTAAAQRHTTHYELVAKAVELIATEERSVGGQLGRPSGARFRIYERMKHHAEALRGTLYESPLLNKALDEIYRFPLTSFATDTVNRLLKAGSTDVRLIEVILSLREEGRLCQITDEGDNSISEPRIICSMGLIGPAEGESHVA